jgi:hypothetical protein
MRLASDGFSVILYRQGTTVMRSKLQEQLLNSHPGGNPEIMENSFLIESPALILPIYYQ